MGWRINTSHYVYMYHRLYHFSSFTETPDTVSVSAVNHGPMIEGREYQLRCDIKNMAAAQLQVKWYKGNETLSTEDIELPTVIPFNVSSPFNITPERNDDGSVIRCEAELQLGPKGPALHPAASTPYIANVQCKIPRHHLLIFRTLNTNFKLICSVFFIL